MRIAAILAVSGAFLSQLAFANVSICNNGAMVTEGASNLGGVQVLLSATIYDAGVVEYFRNNMQASSDCYHGYCATVDNGDSLTFRFFSENQGTFSSTGPRGNYLLKFRDGGISIESHQAGRNSDWFFESCTQQ